MNRDGYRVMEVPDLKTESGRRFLDSLLLQSSFIAGPSPSQADTMVYNRLASNHQVEDKDMENLTRWLSNMNSFEASERKAFPASPININIAQSQDGKEVQHLFCDQPDQNLDLKTV